MEKIPEHILEAINCGEKNAADFYEKYGKEAICQALERVKASDEEIFGKYDSEKIYESVKKKANQNNNQNRNGKKLYSLQKFVPLAVAAVLVVMVLPGIVRNEVGKNGIEFSNSSSLNFENTVRIKGGKARNMGTMGTDPFLQLYQQTENGVVALKSGAKLSEGDLIQIAFNQCGKKYGMIFSIDGNHNLTSHFGSENFEFLEMPSKLNYLDFSYELDDAPEFEVFILISGDRPLNQWGQTSISGDRPLNQRGQTSNSMGTDPSINGDRPLESTESLEFKSSLEILKTKKLNQLKNKKFIKKIINKSLKGLNSDFEVSTFVILK